MVRFIVSLCALVLAACSIADSDDRAQLEQAIKDSGALPSLIEKIVSDRQIRYLSTRPGNDKVASIKCEPSGGLAPHDVTVGDVIGEMLATGSSFREALDDLIDGHKHEVENLYGKKCVHEYDWRYVGEKAAEELSEDEAKRVTVSDVADWIVASPLPPTGLAWGGALGKLLPVLCGMAVQWGCPESPDYPGTLPTNPSGPVSGDAP